MVEHCFRTKKTMVNPIVDWTDDDVWEFLNEVAKVSHCKLYDPPYSKKRLGCIGCPMAGKKGMISDFEQYPKYKAAYIKAFDKMIGNHLGNSVDILDKRIPVDKLSGSQVLDWWIWWSGRSRTTESLPESLKGLCGGMNYEM